MAQKFFFLKFFFCAAADCGFGFERDMVDAYPPIFYFFLSSQPHITQSAVLVFLNQSIYSSFRILPHFIQFIGNFVRGLSYFLFKISYC